jgi:hypothetical protein
MTSPDGRPVFISNVPWHLSQEHDDLPNLARFFCDGENCKTCHCPKALCDSKTCVKPCEKCDKGGTAKDGEW